MCKEQNFKNGAGNCVDVCLTVIFYFTCEYNKKKVCLENGMYEISVYIGKR